MIMPVQGSRRRRGPATAPDQARAWPHAHGGAGVEVLTRAEIAITAALAATPFVFHWLYGALVSEIALLLVATQAVLLGAILTVPPLRRDIPGCRDLAAAGVLFVAVLAVAAWSLTPNGGAATAQAWSLVGLRAMGTLDCSATLVEMVKLAGLAAAFVAAAAIGRARGRMNLALRLIVYFGAAFALLSILLSSADAIYATQGRRVEARFLNPNTAGVVFGALALLGLAMIWRRLSSGEARAKPVSLALDLACFAILSSALLSTLSRGALAATFFAAVFLVAWELVVSRRSRGRWPSPRIAAAMAGCAAVAAIVAWAFLDRVGPHLFEIQDDVRTRSLTAAVHWRAIGDAPWFGFGLGTFETVNTLLFRPDTFPRLWNIRAAQNVYIQWLEQAGWVGALCMFACLAAVVAGPLRLAWRGGPAAWRARALIAVDLIMVLHGFVDFSLETYSVALFWALLLGLNFGAAVPVIRKGWKKAAPIGAASLAAACLSAAVIGLLALDGASAINSSRSPALVAAGLDRASDLLVAAAGSGEARVARLERARALSWAALRQAPCDTGAWLRLAEIDVAKTGDLSPAGVAALRNSYRVAPIDPYQAFWRTRFVLEHWVGLPADIMNDTDREVAALAASWPHRETLATTLNDVVSQRGQIVAALWVSLYKLPKISDEPANGESIG
jgi:O-antigen ligase